MLQGLAALAARLLAAALSVPGDALVAPRGEEEVGAPAGVGAGGDGGWRGSMRRGSAGRWTGVMAAFDASQCCLHLHSWQRALHLLPPSEAADALGGSTPFTLRLPSPSSRPGTHLRRPCSQSTTQSATWPPPWPSAASIISSRRLWVRPRREVAAGGPGCNGGSWRRLGQGRSGWLKGPAASSQPARKCHTGAHKA